MATVGGLVSEHAIFGGSQILKARFTGAELGWTLEDNDLINRAILAVGGKKYKTYRIYEREI